ncbi:MAG: hypothetical protein ACJ786_17925 [Catenulispora sp.]
MSPALDPNEPPYRVHVLWHRQGAPEPNRATCHIIPGYSGLENLPDMLAIRYLAGQRERNEVVLDHVCRAYKWRLIARDTDGAALSQLVTDDEQLLPTLAQVLLGAETAAGVVAQIEFHDIDAKTTHLFPAEPRTESAAAGRLTSSAVYVLSIAEADFEPEEYTAGGAVHSADIDLNTAFGGNKEPATSFEAEDFAANIVWQLDGFPLDLRRRAHEVSARAVAAYPEALQTLSALLIADPTLPVDTAGNGGASPTGAR